MKTNAEKKEQTEMLPRRSMSSRFQRGRRGATAIEYGILASILAVGIFASVGNIGSKMSQVFNNADTALNG